MATGDSKAIEYRGYLISMADSYPFLQAIINPKKRGMIAIDWALNPIFATEQAEAEKDARERIDAALFERTELPPQ